MHKTFTLAARNEAIFELLDNKSKFLNDCLTDLDRRLIRNKKMYELKSGRYANNTVEKKASLPCDLLYFVEINGKRYELDDFDIDYRMFSDHFEDRMLAKMLILEKLKELN